MGLGYISTYLRGKGYRVNVVDGNFTGDDPYAALDRIDSYDIVGIGCESKNIAEALKIARYAKKKKKIVVMGGLHVSLIKGKILEHGFVDFAIDGEGELPLHRLIQFLNGSAPLASVPGLIYRKGTRVIVRERREIGNLDDLGFPDFRLMGVRRISNYPLVTSRDCPYKCNFCTVGSLSYGKWRARSPDNIITELKLAKERYRIKEFTVLDENFSYDVERVKLFCLKLIKENIALPWMIMEGVRADKVDRELIKLLKISGCHLLIYGIESADRKVFSNSAKGSSLAVVQKAIRLAKSEGMRVGGFFVVGLPGATFASEMKSIRFALKHGLDPIGFWMAIPYYNTKLYKWVTRHARLLREPVGGNLVTSLRTEPFFETPVFSREQIKKAFLIARQPHRAEYQKMIWGPLQKLSG